MKMLFLECVGRALFWQDTLIDTACRAGGGDAEPRDNIREAAEALF
jgi:hypothetical protein